MRVLACCTLFLASVFFALPAQALDKKDFDQVEYAFGINEPKTFEMAPKSLAGERADDYDFIDFEAKRKEKLVTYLDTPDRQFSKKALIVRVREDLKKPWKSKITVKLRAPSPEQFGDLKNYKKAEIDIVNGQKKYSVSYDIKMNPTKIDVRKVDVKAVAELIRKGNSEAWTLVEPVFSQYADQIQQTIVMRALSWEGLVTEISGKVEAEYAVWSPYYRYPKTFVSEISFKGRTSDDNLGKVAQRIENALKEKGIDSDFNLSKTKTTFGLSPNFN
ncbi:hypothetical protein [Desulfospira joergensenii]|uniref:hypothetical protein n=1 Tax=Desulfospira joergensenii TaxID=53329 RepID=UPI0003B7AE06|nr:hypothetical protein [Desulfospira joergensenii]